MSKFDEALSTYAASISDNTKAVVDESLLKAVTKSLGPVIYNEDSARVSCSDKEELARVRNNFLIGKLGMADGPDLDAAIAAVCEEMGSSNRNKWRGAFYYLLVVKLGKQSHFAG
jgi:hypothetical protein